MSLLDRKPLYYLWRPLYRQLLLPAMLAMQGILHRRVLNQLTDMESSNQLRFSALEARSNTLQLLAEHQIALIEQQRHLLAHQQACIDSILAQIRANDQSWTAVEDILLAVYRQSDNNQDPRH